MKLTKENWNTDLCQEIDSGIITWSSRADFNTLKLPTQRQQTTLIENTKGKLVTEEKAIHKHWTEYCTELCYYKLKADANIVENEDKIESRETGEAPMLKEAVKKAVWLVKDNKSPGVDNIQTEVLNHGEQGKYGPWIYGSRTRHGH